MITGNAPNRILIRCPNWIGDAVMATPALRAVRERFPESHIALLAKPRIAELLEGLPHFDEVIAIPDDRSLRGFTSFALSLREKTFDLGLILTHSFSSALLARIAGVKRRVGYHMECRGFLLTDGLEVPKDRCKKRPQYMVDEYLAMVGHVGCDVKDRSPRLAVLPETMAYAEELLVAGDRVKRPLVGIAPGASFGPSKRWYPERWAAVADALAENAGASIAILTSPAERDLYQEIESKMGTRPLPLHDVPVPIKLLKAIVSELDLMLCTDSGARHIAVGLGVPTVVLMGPTDPRYSASEFEKGTVIRQDVECSPCHKKICPTDHRCMKQISPEKVGEAAATLLKQSIRA